MINISELSLNFSGEPLFKDVNLKFTQGNCYGVIGANGAGKSTFLRILSGDLDPSTGTVSIAPKTRMSVLKQDHFAFNDETVLNTVLGGNERLLAVMREKDALYMKDPFTEEDGNKAAELEAEFAEMGGWDAETETSQLLNGLGLDADAILYTEMKNLGDVEKVKVLLARALFGKPDILLLDEPTNHLDIQAIRWLEDFLADFEGTVLVVSHDRHFLNNVCTHIVDIDYGKIKLYVGNYEFWYESSQLVQRMIKDQNRKNEEDQGAAELYPALCSEQVQVPSGDKPPQADRQADRRGNAGVLSPLSVGRVPAGPRGRQGYSRGPRHLQDHRRREGARQRFVHRAPRRQDRVHLGQRTCNDHAVPDPDGRDEAGRGQLQVGRYHLAELFPEGQQRVLRRSRGEYARLDRAYSQTDTLGPRCAFLGRMLFSGDDVYKAGPRAVGRRRSA